MKRVLLITDSERVQRVFQSLEENGLLQLRTAPTLVRGDEEIAQAAPDYVFLQSRISGLSGEIAARHLQKSLPRQAKVVLLTVDEEDAAQARKHGSSSLPLDLDDQEVADAVARMLQGKRLPKKASSARPAASAKTVPEPQKTVSAPDEEQGFVALSPPVPVLTRPLETEVEEAEEPPRLGEEPQGPAAASFATLIDRAAGKAPAAGAMPEVRDLVDLSAAPVSPERGETEPLHEYSYEKAAAPIRIEDYLASLQRRKEQHKHRPWVIPLALALVFIPLVYFIATSDLIRRPARSSKATVAPAKAPAAAPPAAVMPPLAGAPGSVATQPPSAQKPAAPAAGAPAQATQAQSGLKGIPPFLAEVRIDVGYSQSHPGWQRFLGAKAEYRLFNQNNLYRAIQVLAKPGQAIPDTLFKKIMREFGGTDAYRILAREKMGGYLIERGESEGNIALTIYRNEKNQAMKGLVLYYR